jgi:exodeoxyribonuclease VII small subunit
MSEENISYNEAVSEIETILAQIENDELDVDELGNKIKHVSKLLNLCKVKLRNAEEEVDKIIKNMDEQDKPGEEQGAL